MHVCVMFLSVLRKMPLTICDFDLDMVQLTIVNQQRAEKAGDESFRVAASQVQHIELPIA